MSLVDLILTGNYDASLSCKFEPYPCRSIEIRTVDGETEVTSLDLPPNAVDDWIDEKGLYQAGNSPLSKTYLRLLYQAWSPDSEIHTSRKIPFTKNTFEHLSQDFNFPAGFTTMFHENGYIPFHVTKTGRDKSISSIIFQSPRFDGSFASLVLSYNAKTGVTSGYLGTYQDESYQNLISAIRKVSVAALHPLLLPLIFFSTWIDRLDSEVLLDRAELESDILVIRKQLSLVPTTLEDFNNAHISVLGLYYSLNSSLESFINKSVGSLSKHINNISDIVTSTKMEPIKGSHEELKTAMEILVIRSEPLIDNRRRLRESIHMQIQVLYNMMQREDSKRMQGLADESRQIAADSRRIAERTLLGSEEMTHLAADAKKLSEAMRVDSVALKSISITTMVFLPGTAIATIFSMGSFFSTSPGGDLIISKQFWVYWLLTIPVTILVFGFWWFWTGKETRRILGKKLQVDFEANQEGDKASTRMEHKTSISSGTPTGTEFSAMVATAVNLANTSVLPTERRGYVE